MTLLRRARLGLLASLALILTGAAPEVTRIPVAVQSVTWTTVLIGVLNLLVGGLLVAIVRTRPALKKIANEREATALEARGEDMEEMRKRLTLLEERVTTATESAHAAELKLVSALKLDPDNTILRQAQELLNVSYPTPRAKVAPTDTIRSPSS